MQRSLKRVEDKLGPAQALPQPENLLLRPENLEVVEAAEQR